MTRVPCPAPSTAPRCRRRALALLATARRAASLVALAALAPSTTRAAGFATLVKEANPSNSEAGIYEQTVVNGRFFFVATGAAYGEELWVTDGTAAGTHILRDIASEGAISAVSNLTAVGDTLFFVAYANGGYDAQVWRSDGTAEGMVSIWPASPDGYPVPRALINVNGALLPRRRERQ